jgi:molybdopterin molybdotransferase
MDGYAVRSSDVRHASASNPVTLRVVATVPAGASTTHTLGAGEAIRIMTGAPVPAGADSVIRVEDTDAGERAVRVVADRDALRNIRPKGEDVGRGAVAVASGAELHAGHLGLLASVGRREVRVYRRARVALLASGDELVDVDRFDEVLAGTKIVSSNTYSLDAAIRETGAEPVSLGTVGDDPVALRDRLSSAEGDLLITTGGVSVGAFDYTTSSGAFASGQAPHWGLVCSAASRGSACRAIPCRRWSRSSCSPAPRCAGCTATHSSSVARFPCGWPKRSRLPRP